MAFSSHNVLLPDGTYTAPDLPVVADTDACTAALRALYEEFGENHTGVTVADLGSLEGGYAAAFAQAGFEVTGFEARAENHENAVVLQQRLDLPNLHFVQGDVRETVPGTEFDVVFCSGLLYHLNEPVAFLNLLGEVTKRMLILNTHYSMGPAGHAEGSHHAGYGCTFGDFVNEGKRGHWCRESKSRWDGVSDEDSFWLLKEDLLDSIRDAGFYRVDEVTDWRSLSSIPHVPGGPGPVADRGMFLAFKG